MFITVDDPTCLLVPSGFDGACSKGKKVFVISKHPATLMLKISTNSALQLEIFLIKNLRWSGLTNLIIGYNNNLILELPIYISSHIVRMVSVWNSSIVDQNVQLIYAIFFYHFEALLNRFRRCNITTIIKKSTNNFLDFKSHAIYFIESIYVKCIFNLLTISLGVVYAHSERYSVPKHSVDSDRWQ